MKLNTRDAIHTDSTRKLPANVRRCALQRGHRCLNVVGVTKRGYKHDGVAQVRRDRYALNSNESNRRVFQVALKKAAYLPRDLSFNPLGTAGLDDAASGATGDVVRCGWPR